MQPAGHPLRSPRERETLLACNTPLAELNAPRSARVLSTLWLHPDIHVVTVRTGLRMRTRPCGLASEWAHCESALSSRLPVLKRPRTTQHLGERAKRLRDKPPHERALAKPSKGRLGHPTRGLISNRLQPASTRWTCSHLPSSHQVKLPPRAPVATANRVASSNLPKITSVSSQHARSKRRLCKRSAPTRSPAIHCTLAHNNLVPGRTADVRPI